MGHVVYSSNTHYHALNAELLLLVALGRLISIGLGMASLLGLV